MVKKSPNTHRYYQFFVVYKRCNCIQSMHMMTNVNSWPKIQKFLKKLNASFKKKQQQVK